MDQGTIILTVAIGFGFCMLSWILHAFVNPAKLVSSYWTKFSTSVAIEFQGLIVCPQKLVFFKQSPLPFFVMGVACGFFIVKFWTMDFGLDFFLALFILVCSILYCFRQFKRDLVVSYFEKYCLTHLLIAMHSKTEADKFQQKMLVAKTISEIDLFFFEASQSMQSSLSKKDSHERANSRPDANVN